jgi:hypothetical protein
VLSNGGRIICSDYDKVKRETKKSQTVKTEV